MLQELLTGVAWAQTAGNATTPPLPSTGIGWSGYLQTLAVVFFLLALLMGGFYLLKRFGPARGRFFGPGGKSLLRLEAQLPVGPRKTVVVVRFLNKRLVLGVTDQQINLLDKATADHDEPDSFSHTLHAHSDDPD